MNDIGWSRKPPPPHSGDTDWTPTTSRLYVDDAGGFIEMPALDEDTEWLLSLNDPPFDAE